MCDRKSRLWLCVSGFIVLFLVLLLVFATVGIRHTRLSYGASLCLTVGGTRLISYSSAFCESLTLDNTATPNNLKTNLSVILSPQPDKLLTDHVDFTIDATGLALTSDLYHYWKVFVRRGSTVVLEACIVSGKGMNFEMIREGGLNLWRAARDPSDRHTFTVLGITNSCSEGLRQNYSFYPQDFEISGVYYFVLSGMESEAVNVLNGTLHFTIPEYNTETEVELYKHSPCTTGGGVVRPCTVPVPLYPGSYGVISAEDTSLGPISSVAAVDVSWSCNPRIWVYAVMVIAPVGVTVGCLVCVWLCVKARLCDREVVVDQARDSFVADLNYRQ